MLGLRLRALRLRYGLDYGRMVHGRVRFALNEAVNRNRVREYRPRGAAMTVSLRHHHSPHGTPSNDTWTLREIFRDDCYRPPAAVDARLRATPEPRIVDVGANVGLFSAYMLARYPGATIVAIEPDPDSAALLERALASVAASTVLYRAAAATAVGSVRFSSGIHQFSHVAEDGEAGAIEVPTLDALPLFEGADFAKIDIEGGEWDLLADERFATCGPAGLVMEYHPRLCPEADPERCARRLLERAGYVVIPHVNPAVPDEPILWAMRAS